MLNMLKETKSHMANHIIIGNVFIKNVYKQLFLTKLMMDIILRGSQSCAKDYTDI